MLVVSLGLCLEPCEEVLQLKDSLRWPASRRGVSCILRLTWSDCLAPQRVAGRSGGVACFLNLTVPGWLFCAQRLRPQPSALPPGFA